MSRAWLLDTGERVGLTFLQAFAGGLVLAGAGIFTLSAVHAAALAGVAAALAVLKAAAASALTTMSPASLVPAAPTATVRLQVDTSNFMAAFRQAIDASLTTRTENAAVHVETIPSTDARLARHVEHDERSRNYPARTAPLRTVHHRHYGRVLDQGSTGSCTGNALVDCLMTTPLHKTGRVLTEGDAVKVYSLATQLDSIPGQYPPTDTGSSGLSACKAAVKLGLISGYRHAFGLDDCLAALVLSPVMIGINWYESMFTPDADGLLTVSGKVAGGHEVALVGLDVRKRLVTVQNSWGPSWGKHGRAYLSFDDLGRLLAEQGDVTVPVGR